METRSPAIIVTIYTMFCIASLTLNSFVIYIIIFKLRQTSFNILLLQLAVSDALSTFSCAMFYYVQNDYESSNFLSNLACGITTGLTPYFLCSSVTLLTLSFISVTRRFSIVKPLKHQTSWIASRKTLKCFFVISWLSSILIIAPNALTFKYDPETKLCSRHWPPYINGPAYAIGTFLFGYIGPLIVLSESLIVSRRVLNKRFQLTRRVRGQVNKSNGHTRVTPPTKGRFFKSRQRSITLLIALALTFLIAWSPYFIYWILSRATNVFKSGIEGDIQRLKWIQISLLISNTNAIVDPILYGLISHDFRRIILRMLPGRLFSNSNKVKPIVSSTVGSRSGLPSNSGLN